MSRNLPKIRVRRHPERGHYDRATIEQIVDEAYYCHVAVVRDGAPVIIPTLHVRVDDSLYIHGAVAAGLFKDMKQDAVVSVAITLLDGLVLARSFYNHSANYRSVVAFGVAREVTDPDEKLRVLKALADRVVPGRWDDARPPNDTELKITRVFAIPLDHASVKIRTGPPSDDVDDLTRPTWAGVIPLKMQVGQPQPDPLQQPPMPLPDYLNQNI
ncbi:MAG: pyridoxamine 5'-phosphate oxidase family protein [Sulfobacillus acidophilus]|uniref:Pyridoxamine 5'-phosphate oxidase family protein n=1 Tax=Sulfobacillus acidophilus TaxID=53633 RepID=A0A2T2WI61_9FIRM|nr:MAG: pyridoxamine 5'-phosphate oxidase family protein [Sulfobacillus acidophilus]